MSKHKHDNSDCPVSDPESPSPPSQCHDACEAPDADEGVSTTHPLATIAKECGLSETHDLLRKFVPYYEQALPLVMEARDIVISDATQVSEMKRARTLRLELRQIRIAAEKERVATKADALKLTQAIDKIAGTITKSLNAEEERLEQEETYPARMEAKRKMTLRETRCKALDAYGADLSGIDAAELSEEGYAALLESSRMGFERQQEEARQIRQAAEARAAEAEAERQKLVAENARLAKEKQEADAAAAQARADAERAQRAARDAQDKADREAAAARRQAREAAERAEAQKVAEARAQKQREAAEAEAQRRAEAAPDVEKMATFAQALAAVPMPSMSSESGKAFANRMKAEIERVVEMVAEWRDALTR